MARRPTSIRCCDAGDIEAETNTRSEATGEVAARSSSTSSGASSASGSASASWPDAKAYMTGSFPLTIETPGAIATQVLNVVFYGLDLDELQTYRERVNAVTPDDVQRVARAYLRPDRLSIVLVGNATAFASQLRGIGFNPFERMELTDLDLGAADFKRRGVPPTGAAGGLQDGSARTGGRAGREGATKIPRPQRVRCSRGSSTPRAGSTRCAASAAAHGRRRRRAAWLRTPAGPAPVDTTTACIAVSRPCAASTTTAARARCCRCSRRQRAWVRDGRGAHAASRREPTDPQLGLQPRHHRRLPGRPRRQAARRRASCRTRQAGRRA